jgi:NAD(P)-dependent dehydrogenase (short-subunit alcohol dehydrogenase family)
MAEWTKRFSLEGKRALVTGATKGIGYEISKVLADAGADIAAVGRDKAGLDEIAGIVRGMGRKCVPIAADMATADGPVTAARTAIEAFGTIDILVNNAGVALLDPLLTAKIADWDETMAVNLRAPFLLAQQVVPGMIKQRAGKIINISSQSGVIGLEAHGAYCASKGGLNLLTKVMTVEWAKYNIQANAVCPNVILTPMGEKVWGRPEKGKPMLDKTPLGRFGRPVEVADMVLYLASSASDMVCGDVLLIDGGYTAA